MDVRLVLRDAGRAARRVADAEAQLAPLAGREAHLAVEVPERVRVAGGERLPLALLADATLDRVRRAGRGSALAAEHLDARSAPHGVDRVGERGVHALLRLAALEPQPGLEAAQVRVVEQRVLRVRRHAAVLVGDPLGLPHEAGDPPEWRRIAIRWARLEAELGDPQRYLWLGEPALRVHPVERLRHARERADRRVVLVRRLHVRTATEGVRVEREAGARQLAELAAAAAQLGRLAPVRAELAVEARQLAQERERAQLGRAGATSARERQQLAPPPPHPPVTP